MKKLFERNLVRVVGLCGDILSIVITLDFVSYARENVANSDTMQRSDIPAKSTSFTHIGTLLSFSLMTGHPYDIANCTTFLIITILPLDMLLSH